MAVVLAFMHLYSIFNLRFFLSVLFFICLNLVLKRQTERSMVPGSPNCISLFVSNTEGTYYRLMFICFTFVKCACFILYSTSVRFDLVEIPEVILCG